MITKTMVLVTIQRYRKEAPDTAEVLFGKNNEKRKIVESVCDDLTEIFTGVKDDN